MIFLDDRLIIRLRKEFKDEINSSAAKLKMSVAEFVRAALRAFIDGGSK
jgi:hypothetical protein